MNSNRKSPGEAKDLGGHLKQLRKKYALTLEEVAHQTKIDVGQLSRFERGDFVFVGENLQKYINFLQIQSGATNGETGLVARFTAVLKKSDRHSAAARAMLTALESLL